MAIFLLGGCDLEMVVIKRLLNKYNQKFIDKNLKWGAKLSDYQEEIKKYQNEMIYAIELIPDIEAKNLILIDHHNDDYKKPSSLEQIASLFKHKLTPFEKAVALNDKGYIYEMLRGGINLSDIKRIRKLDRKAQGVTEEEEKIANEIKLDRIIYFPYEHFSPLTDRIFFEKGWRKFIIYNDNLTMFYGFDKNHLKKILNYFNIEASFWGKSYLGVLEKIDENILRKIYNMRKEKSIHTFMFPFVIKDQKDFKEKLSKEWEKKEFKFSKVEYYNDYMYFYPHVGDVLFSKNDGIATYYEKNLKNGKYIITLLNGIKYELEIEDISLRVFNGSIGILSFHLINYEYDYLDILKINEFGRRIFPQFLDRKKLLVLPKEIFLADSIEVILNGQPFAKEDFSKFNDFNLNVESIEKELLPSFIYKLIGNIRSIIDDRMFVISFYLDDGEIVDKLIKFDDESYSFVNNDWWYKYVFIDGGDKTCQSKILCPKLIKKSTYDRWIEYGTLWGISRYSFVGIAKRCEFSENVLLIHAKTIYYQMMVLLLMYRAMIVYFSDRVQDIVEKVENTNDIKKIKENSKNLYRDYLKFLNGLYFREVTPQEQGIEIYKKALEIMEIESEIKDFDREISELDSYIEFLAEENRNEELEKLNKLGALFLPPTLLASIFGMNVGMFDEHKQIKFLIALILFILSIRIGELQFLSNKDDRILEKLKNFCPIKIDEKLEKYILVGVLIVSIILLGII